jgi:hypothetical protein
MNIFCETIGENKKEKYCKGCNTIKFIDFFNKNKTKKDGYSFYCKACDAIRMKSYSRTLTPVESKICTVCSTDKTADNYHKNKNYADGLDNRCKECKSINNQRIKIKDKVIIFSKKCAKCKKDMDINCFHKDASRKDGYARICKSCAIENSSKWAKENCFKATKNKQSYRAKKMTSQPSWLSKDDVAAIDFFYWFSEGISGLHGKEYHVDHIHALQGKNFSGLHVPWNLQILEASENISKGNRVPSNELDLFWTSPK